MIELVAGSNAIVDDEALTRALKPDKVAAAGLKVYRGENDTHPAYRELPTTCLLPRIGSAKPESRDTMDFRILGNLDAVFAGRETGNRLA